jgi:hypothetical protein
LSTEEFAQSNPGEITVKRRLRTLIAGIILAFFLAITISLEELEVYTGDKDGVPLTTISLNYSPTAGKPRSELAQENKNLFFRCFSFRCISTEKLD